MNELLKIFGKVEDDLKFIATSGVRIKMLNSLLERPKTSTELKDEFKIGASTIIHTARDLEKEGYIREEKEGFSLTPVGKIIAIYVTNYIKLLSVIKENKEYWLSHKIDALPEEFLVRLGELQKLRIVKATPTNLLQVLSLYVKMVVKAKKLKGVSPVFVPEFSKLIKRLIKKGGEAEIVISKDIKKPVIESYKKEIDEETERKVREGKLKLWEIEDVGVAMTVTDQFISIGFFNNDGSYDFSQDLVSYEKEAIKWGRELFEYYRSKAKEISLY